MAKLPDNRYQTAAELHDDLERFRNGRPVQATPLLDAAATTQAIPRGDGGADPTAMLGGVTAADRATRYAEPYEPYEEERRTSVGWVVVSLLALVLVGVVAFFITRAVTGTGTETTTTLAPTTTQAPTTTEAPSTTERPTTTTEPPTTTKPPTTTQPPTSEPATSEPATSEPGTT